MNPRLAAAKALAAVLNGKASLNSSLPTQLDKVEDRDRGFTQDLAFGTARWQPRLSALAAKLLQKPFKAADADVEALLLVGLYQLLYTRVPAHAAIGETVGCADKLKKPWAKALLNAVLRRAQRESEALLAELEHDPVVRTAHPRWLQKSLKAFWPEQWEAICAANNAHPPMILRVNRRHHSRDAYLQLLTDAGITPRRVCTASTASCWKRPPTYAACLVLPKAGSACRTKPRNWPPTCSTWRPANACSTPAARRAVRPVTFWKSKKTSPLSSPSTWKPSAWCACAKTSPAWA